MDVSTVAGRFAWASSNRVGCLPICERSRSSLTKRCIYLLCITETSTPIQREYLSRLGYTAHCSTSNVNPFAMISVAEFPILPNGRGERRNWMYSMQMSESGLVNKTLPIDDEEGATAAEMTPGLSSCPTENQKKTDASSLSKTSTLGRFHSIHSTVYEANQTQDFFFSQNPPEEKRSVSEKVPVWLCA